MNKTLIAIGGGELRAKETAGIDAYIANLGKLRAGEERRANALFFPTASHDSLPYFNTFRKTYTSDNHLKSDVALLTKKDIPMEKIVEKVNAADVIYVGGGDTLFMLDVWKKTGVDKLILDAYERGVIISGLSAGAICWFRKMYSDVNFAESGRYVLCEGLGVFPYLITPHYNLRRADFAEALQNGESALALEDKSAAVLVNGKVAGSLSDGGSAFWVSKTESGVAETPIDLIQ